MLESFAISGIAAFLFKDVHLPSCIVGSPIQNSGYCVSAQYTDIKIDYVSISKKNNTDFNNLKITVDFDKYGSFSIPYRKNSIVLEYKINLD